VAVPPVPRSRVHHRWELAPGGKVRSSGRARRYTWSKPPRVLKIIDLPRTDARTYGDGPRGAGPRGDGEDRVGPRDQEEPRHPD